jgi:hypothetical protein
MLSESPRYRPSLYRCRRDEHETPGNGGIKIQVVRIIYQCAFRKIAEIRRPSVQEVSGHFGMPGRTSRSLCDASLPLRRQRSQVRILSGAPNKSRTCSRSSESALGQTHHKLTNEMAVMACDPRHYRDAEQHCVVLCAQRVRAMEGERRYDRGPR